MATCENCGCEHDGKYGSGRFCSVKCSRGFSTKAKRKEINEAVKNKANLRKPIYEYVCVYCKKIFVAKKKAQKYCSKTCTCSYKNEFFNMAHNAGIKSSTLQFRRSKNEIYFSELCKNHFHNVKTNENIFNGWDADIIIEDLKIAVLWNGKWHYEKITEKHSLKQVQNRDRIKLKEIKSCGYKSYIIKDMGSYDKKFVELKFQIFLNSIATTKFK
jgi:hypothetical protein